jgi:hypothetical protein
LIWVIAQSLIRQNYPASGEFFNFNRRFTRKQPMIVARFKGEPEQANASAETESGKCKCGRCTRNDERSDSSMASSDLN